MADQTTLRDDEILTGAGEFRAEVSDADMDDADVDTDDTDADSDDTDA